MTNNSDSQTRASQSIVQMVGALNELRDKLVSLSLTLQDYKFDLDTCDRQQIDPQLQKIIEKSKGQASSQGD